MKNASKRDLINTLKKRYARADTGEKSRILDELCQTLECHRKHAIRVLSSISQAGKPKKAGRKKKYHSAGIVSFVMEVRRMSNCICSKRLVHAFPLFLPYTSIPLTPEERLCIKAMSASTVDRVLRPHIHASHKVGLSTTKPGTLLKKQIPIKTGQWDETLPGYVETDTVAHCGDSVAGTFVYTVNMIDIATGWSIQRAIWGKGQLSCFAALQQMEKALPFRLLGFDCDNGTEVLNHHLREYFCERKNPVDYTRSRPYQKNDNAHVEQKNWSIVRQYLGYMRFDQPCLVELINDLYANELYMLNNFFIPSFKLLDKKREGAKIIKKHDPPKTPLERLLQAETLPAYKCKELLKKLKVLNPYELHRSIDQKVKRILTLAVGANA